MTNAVSNKHKGKSMLSVVVAAIIGVFVGAFSVIAGRAALKDEKNIKKVNKVISDVKDQAIDYIGKIKKGANKTIHHIEKEE
ncbi:MAG: hypothetical protein A2Y40_00230 [Candidatus Margulisbacteria bacterium GWF2_35_9]|nr:MAG: hypothetical protein A2Y40_00230 [Candidatus Margulisbacteria bacterium GWF2_35_9]